MFTLSSPATRRTIRQISMTGLFLTTVSMGTLVHCSAFAQKAPAPDSGLHTQERPGTGNPNAQPAQPSPDNSATPAGDGGSGAAELQLKREIAQERNNEGLPVSERPFYTPPVSLSTVPVAEPVPSTGGPTISPRLQNYIDDLHSIDAQLQEATRKGDMRSIIQLEGMQAERLHIIDLFTSEGSQAVDAYLTSEARKVLYQMIKTTAESGNIAIGATSTAVNNALPGGANAPLPSRLNRTPKQIRALIDGMKPGNQQSGVTPGGSGMTPPRTERNPELMRGDTRSALQGGGKNPELMQGGVRPALQSGGKNPELMQGGVWPALQGGGKNPELMKGGVWPALPSPPPTSAKPSLVVPGATLVDVRQAVTQDALSYGGSDQREEGQPVTPAQNGAGGQPTPVGGQASLPGSDGPWSPLGGTVTYIPGMEPHQFVNPKTGETTWVNGPLLGPPGWKPVLVAPLGGTSSIVAGTGPAVKGEDGQPTPSGGQVSQPASGAPWSPVGGTVSYIPGMEPRQFVNPATGETTWVSGGLAAPKGWKPLLPSAAVETTPKTDFKIGKPALEVHTPTGALLKTEVGVQKLRAVTGSEPFTPARVTNVESTGASKSPAAKISAFETSMASKARIAEAQPAKTIAKPALSIEQANSALNATAGKSGLSASALKMPTSLATKPALSLNVPALAITTSLGHITVTHR